jgi:decaprenylphospho-beta-D-ribofuranose 2-oxidase
MHASLNIASFDRTERLTASVVRPESYPQLLAAIADHGLTIARGSGLSYSPASFDSVATSIDLTRFDRVLGFDASTGDVVVEPGVQVGALSEFLARVGRQLPALPGYPTITVGGCAAFDSHGKSQFHSGTFGASVRSLTLYHRDHGELSCSREQQAELFELTIGGMGLTGVITELVLRTAPLPAPHVSVRAVPVRSLRDAADMLQAEAASADCLYSWNDLNLPGNAFGAGVVFVEHFVTTPPQRAWRRLPKPLIPARSELPACSWNRLTTRLALGAFAKLQVAERVVTLQDALFPIHGKEFYYAAFGPKGLREYQLIVPHARWSTFVSALQALLVRARLPVTLGSLKLFRGEPSLLRFRGAGICLALDVPASRRSAALFEALDDLAFQHDAVVNISKDSRLAARACQRLFPEYAKFKTELARFDPQRRCRSRLRTVTGV